MVDPSSFLQQWPRPVEQSLSQRDAVEDSEIEVRLGPVLQEDRQGHEERSADYSDTPHGIPGYLDVFDVGHPAHHLGGLNLHPIGVEPNVADQKVAVSRVGEDRASREDCRRTSCLVWGQAARLDVRRRWEGRHGEDCNAVEVLDTTTSHLMDPAYSAHLSPARPRR